MTRLTALEKRSGWYKFQVGRCTYRTNKYTGQTQIVKVDKFEKIEYKQTKRGWVRK